MSTDTARWGADQVLALAPDTSAQKAARGLVAAGKWPLSGTDDDGLLWGECRGSGSTPYQVSVDVSGPAFRCSCPSRKLPCKHALALLLRWAEGALAAGVAPTWAAEWAAARAARATRVASGKPREVNPATVVRRAERVAAGMDELSRWLDDQVRTGLAGLTTAGYEPFDTLAARLVDAQAPGAAGLVRRLAGAAVSGSPERLLTEVGLLHLLATGYRRLEQLPPALAATVRSRAGLSVSADEVMRGVGVRDRWAVIGLVDETDDRLTTRRIWLRGCDTGRPALVLSFAAPGQVLAADLVLGTAIDAELHFFPGAAPLRALVGTRHGGAVCDPPADDVATALRGWAVALSGDPWLDRWPVLLDAVVPTPTHLVEPDGPALPLRGDPWRLVAAAGGTPCRIMGEYGPLGIRPLTAWVEDRVITV